MAECWHANLMPRGANEKREAIMRDSRDRILTTHVGSLPRPDDLIAMNRAFAAGETHDDTALRARQETAVAEVVRRQRLAGIDIPNDGEFGKATEHRINFGAW